MSDRVEERPVMVVVNPTAGLGAVGDAARARAEQAAAFAVAHGSAVEVVVTTQAGHARELALAAVRRGARMVFAWGGDGTVNEVASSLAGSDTVLAVVPAGSGNGLARELNLPLNPRLAFDAAMAGVNRRIDLGSLDGRVFVNVAGVGLDARVAQRFAEIGRDRRGLAVYVRAAVREIVLFRPDDLTIEVGGGRYEVRPLIIAFANGRQYGNGATVAPGARIDDGLLHVVIIASRSIMGILRGVPALFGGRLDVHPGVTTHAVVEAQVTGASPLICHVDGEPHVGGSRVDVRILPGALTVRVPARG
jgi:YegS/Rv2252/BmrU family lipid kinase